MTGIDGKVIAITGASSGIGEASARLLAERGATVVLGARRVERLDALAAELRTRGGRALTVKVDVTQHDQVKQLVARAVNELGGLDVLFSNAGISKIGPMSDLDVDGWTAMIDVNLRGVLHGIAAALPVFQRQGHGHLVTTVSTAGLKSVPNMAVYAATKTRSAPSSRACDRSPPTARCAPRPSRPGTSARTSPTPSTTPTSKNWSDRAWMTSRSRRRPLPAPSPSPSNNPTTSRSATSPSGPPSKPDAPIRKWCALSSCSTSLPNITARSVIGRSRDTSERAGKSAGKCLANRVRVLGNARHVCATVVGCR